MAFVRAPTPSSSHDGAVFVLHGVRIRIVDTPPELTGILSAFLEHGPGRWDASGAADMQCALSLTEEPLPPPPPREAVFFHHLGLSGYYQSGGILYTTDDCRLFWDPAAARLSGEVAPVLLDRPVYLGNTIFGIILCECLRQFGLFFVHAAACVRPDGRGFLLPAEGEGGKTSATLALLDHGWSAVTDDAVFLRRESDGIGVYPFRTELHLPARVWKHDPRLAYLEARERMGRRLDKRPIDPEDLYPGQVLPMLANPRYVLFPSIAQTRTTRLERIPSSEAIPHLIPQTPYVLFAKDEAGAREHLDVLRDLLRDADCYHLETGWDVLEEPALLPRLLEDLP